MCFIFLCVKIYIFVRIPEANFLDALRCGVDERCGFVGDWEGQQKFTCHNFEHTLLAMVTKDVFLSNCLYNLTDCLMFHYTWCHQAIPVQLVVVKEKCLGDCDEISGCD